MRGHFLRAAAGRRVGEEPPGPGAEPTLLLHFDGADGGTTITDSSKNNWPISVLGNAHLSTDAADRKFGTAGLVVGASDAYIVTPANDAFTIGTEDFTIDCWCRRQSASGNDGLFAFMEPGRSVAVAVFNGSWRFTNSGGGGVSGGPVSAGQWTHVALTRSDNLVRFFVGGLQGGSTVVWGNYFTQSQLLIGCYFSAEYGWNGAIDEFRYIKGAAVWTEDFTPPSSPYANP